MLLAATDYVQLSYQHVALAALLILINGAISLALKLGMGRTLLLASVRTVGQLLLVGYLLTWVFELNQWPIVTALMLLMTLIAGVTAVRGSGHSYPGIWLNTLVSIGASSWLITLFALFVVIRGDQPWYQPQYAIPLLGMVLGNTLNGITLGLSALTDSLIARRGEVETLLALGATRWEAAAGPIRHAVRVGMIPIINSMMIVGVVSLPGMMTGQILSGAEPLDAVMYQIVIMFLIASGTALGTVAVVISTYLRLFNTRHQYLYERIDSN